jgi:hypothetical protein
LPVCSDRQVLLSAPDAGRPLARQALGHTVAASLDNASGRLAKPRPLRVALVSRISVEPYAFSPQIAQKRRVRHLLLLRRRSGTWDSSEQPQRCEERSRRMARDRDQAPTVERSARSPPALSGSGCDLCSRPEPRLELLNSRVFG